MLNYRSFLGTVAAAPIAINATLTEAVAGSSSVPMMSLRDYLAGCGRVQEFDLAPMTREVVSLLRASDEAMASLPLEGVEDDGGPFISDTLDDDGWEYEDRWRW